MAKPGYNVHLGLFEDDVLLKLATYSYNVVVIYENFKAASVGENTILKELVRQAVDQILNIADVANFRPVLRRGVAPHQELYEPFREALRVVQAR